MYMKTYRAKFNPDAKNVYGVSLVENPAMEGDFIQFSKQEEIKFADVDKSKRRVMGLVLEPNKVIPRYSPDGGYNIVFTEQDIEDVAYNYQKQKNQSKSTIEHDGNFIEGVTFVETWIIENPEKDKSTNFGFSYPKGSWMMVMQFDNEDLYKDYVETGVVKGFSIDAFMQLEEVNLKQVDMSDNKEDNLVQKIVEGVSVAFEKLRGKAPVLESEIETKQELSKQDETKEHEKVDLKDEVKEVKLNADDLASILAEIDKLFAPIKDENVALKEQVKEIETKLSEQNETLVKLAKEPATKTIRKGEDKEKKYEEMTNLEKMEWNRKNKR